MKNNKANGIEGLLKLKVNKKLVNIQKYLPKNKSQKIMFSNNINYPKNYLSLNNNNINNYNNRINNNTININNIVKRINSKRKKNNLNIDNNTSTISNNNKKSFKYIIKKKDENGNEKKDFGENILQYTFKKSEKELENNLSMNNIHNNLNNNYFNNHSLLNHNFKTINSFSNFDTGTFNDDPNFLTYRTIYSKKNLKNPPNENVCYHKRTQINFYRPNIKTKFLLNDSHSVKNINENGIDILNDNLYQSITNPKNENLKNNMTINFDNIQNNFIHRKNSDLIERNYNAYNEKLFMKYKFNLTKEFIKYIYKYLSLYLRNDKIFFFNQLKKYKMRNNIGNIYIKEYKTNFNKNNFIYTSYNNTISPNNQTCLTDRRSININNISNNDLNYSLPKIYENEDRRTYNNFLDFCKNHYNIKKARQLLLDRKNNFDFNKNNKSNSIFNNNTYINSLNNNSFLYINLNRTNENFYKKRSNSSKNMEMSDDENSKKLSISISSKDNFDINDNNKSLNNFCLSHRSNNSNSTNRLTMKLKENKIQKDYLIDNIDSNYNYKNIPNNNSFHSLKVNKKYNNLNTKIINNIYIRKKSFINNPNNKTSKETKNNLKYINNNSKLIIKKRAHSENYNKYIMIKENNDDTDNILNTIDKQENNNNLNSYTYKRAINKGLKNKVTKEKYYKEKNSPEINKILIKSIDNKLNISIKQIELPEYFYQSCNAGKKYENKYLKIFYNLSFQIINNYFCFENSLNAEKDNKCIDMIKTNKNTSIKFHHIKYNNLSKENNSPNREELKQIEYAYNTGSSSYLLRRKKITVNKKMKNNIKEDNCNLKLQLDDYKNVIMNCQNNKYLRGCINFLIKSITKTVYNAFIYLKLYSRKSQLRNIINKINQKKKLKYYFSLYNKRITENGNKKCKNKQKSKSLNININGNYFINKNKINKENKKNVKIVFNNKTNRYELVEKDLTDN